MERAGRIEMHAAAEYEQQSADRSQKSGSVPWNDYRSDVVNGTLKCIQCRIDFPGIKIDNVQSVWRKTKFAGESQPPVAAVSWYFFRNSSAVRHRSTRASRNSSIFWIRLLFAGSLVKIQRARKLPRP